MKKEKLKLANLKVQSFVTDMNEGEKQTIKGGNPFSNPAFCTEVAACQNTQAQVCPSVLLPCIPPTFNCITFDITCQL